MKIYFIYFIYDFLKKLYDLNLHFTLGPNLIPGDGPDATKPMPSLSQAHVSKRSRPCMRNETTKHHIMPPPSLRVGLRARRAPTLGRDEARFARRPHVRGRELAQPAGYARGPPWHHRRGDSQLDRSPRVRLLRTTVLASVVLVVGQRATSRRTRSSAGATTCAGRGRTGECG